MCLSKCSCTKLHSNFYSILFNKVKMKYFTTCFRDLTCLIYVVRIWSIFIHWMLFYKIEFITYNKLPTEIHSGLSEDWNFMLYQCWNIRFSSTAPMIFVCPRLFELAWIFCLYIYTVYLYIYIYIYIQGFIQNFFLAGGKRAKKNSAPAGAAQAVFYFMLCQH